MTVTLGEIREHVEALASEDGEYYVVCGRTGDRPVPVAGKRFDGRATARSAARATEQYRALLRRYDPLVPHYDPIVCQERQMAADSLTAPVVTGDTHEDTPDQAFVEFTHRVAAAVCETLAAEGYEDVESALLSGYFDATDAAPAERCPALLERLSVTLDRQLAPPEQAAVLAAAATRLSPAEPTREPVSAMLAALADRGLVEEYAQSPWLVDRTERIRSVVVHLSGYALSPRAGRLPVAPVVLELYRHLPDPTPVAVRAARADDTAAAGDGEGTADWRLTLVLAADDPTALARAPIEREVKQ